MENNNTVQNVVHGFKVFRPDWTCSPNGNTKQCTCPGKFEEEGELDVCGHGMHFCQTAADCFNYYSFNSENKVAEVIAYGDVRTDGDKSCTDKLEIVREIPWDEVLRIVNIGKNCTGRCNTGDWNTGNRNTGDWNKSSFNTGCFNTEEQKIMLFNKPSDMTYSEWLDSDARYLLNQIPKDVVEWVYEEDMTDEEKQHIQPMKQQAVISKCLMNLNVVSCGGAACQTAERKSSRQYQTLMLKYSSSVRVSG